MSASIPCLKNTVIEADPELVADEVMYVMPSTPLIDIHYSINIFYKVISCILFLCQYLNQ